MSSLDQERRKRAIIIGGGPGGLTAAIALRQAGFESIVYERTCQTRLLGSGLTLWPNAMNALDTLGLAETVRAVSFLSTGIAIRSWRGELLFDTTLHEGLQNPDSVYGIVIHRAELLNVLLQALGNDAVNFGVQCVSYQQDDKSVTAVFDNGLKVCGDVLIGSDGIKSAIRTQLLGATKLTYAGYTVWRGVTEFKLESFVGLTSMGRGAQFGLFPMTHNRVYWFASANAPESDRDWAIGRKRELLERFRDWHEPIKAVIEATEDSSILRNDIYDLDPQSRWSEGRVTLLGDAAHPATPNLGQGTCLAIEDAVVLAKCLREDPVALALKVYESRRLRRTSNLTLESRRLGQIGQWKNPILCWFRNQLIKNTPEKIRLQQLNELFHFEA